ncbi:hypothetical protein M8J77_021783 [Diaphorina citri]|nr:hypothetical protein M8J77_021783 [Diaphorina citri]
MRIKFHTSAGIEPTPSCLPGERLDHYTTEAAAIKSGCHQETISQCESAPCINSGRCTDGWNRYICDCTGTSYSGPICANDDLSVSYNGSQYTLITMPHEVQSQVEDIVLRFRTARPNGFLFSTSSEESPDRLQAAIINGRLVVTIKVGDKDKTIHSGHNLHDNLWHSLKYTRRAMNLLIQLDHLPHVKMEVSLGKQGVLQYHNLHLGSFVHAEEEIQMTNSIPNFIGSIQKFEFNRERYLDLAWNSALQLGPNETPLIRTTGHFAPREQRFVHHAITFRSRQTYVALPTLQAFQSTSIYFQLKTRERDALLLYNAGREADFLAVELVAGHVQLIINLGDGPVRIKDYARTSINDNKWHAISITRPYPNVHSLSVDDVIATAATSSMAATLDLTSLFYIGGIPKEVYLTLPKDLHARHGFEGCLASLEINGNAPDLTTDPLIPSSLTTPGCLGHNNKCSQHVCANRGVCVQQWNSFTCDCDMTSYTGPTCSDESVAYEFGPERGIITFVFPEDRRPEMKSDVLAFAFITNHHDAVILRVESATSNDYIEVEIVEGNIFVVYNMGTNDNPIGETFVKVNDGFYHVVRFTRNAANSTLQLDDFNLQTNFPSGNQLSVFNSVGNIQIGGKWNRSKQRIERPFSGVIAGLVLNGQRVLDLAADKDPRTQIRGDVTLVTSLHERIREPLLQKMQQTPPDHSPGGSDDLVFSGAGSGCPNDDEDSCTPSFDTSPGDDLITPVYVPPTPRSKKPLEPQCRDDDEDCVTDGSGDDRDDVSTPELPSSKSPASPPPSPDLSSESYPNITEPSRVYTDVTSSSSSSSTSYSSSTTTALSTTVFNNEVIGQQIHTTQPQEETTGTHTGPEILKTPGPQVVTPTDLTITNSTSFSDTTTSSKAYNVTHIVDISVTHTDPTTTTTTITSRINVAQSPLPPPPTYMYPPPPFTYPPHVINKNQINSETAEATAFVILVIAGTLIAIILVILLILKLKQNTDHIYTMDETKTSAVAHGHHQALLSNSMMPCSPPPLHSGYNNNNMNPNSSIYNSNTGDVRPMKRQAGHVKEWYV